MKKAWLMVAASVAAMSLGIAAPASAQGCPSGVPSVPSTSTISLENGQIRVNPNGPSEDAADAGEYAGGLADDGIDCAWGQVPPQVWCSYNLVYFGAWYGYYVYEDYYTGEYVVDYGRLSEDANDCL